MAQDYADARDITPQEALLAFVRDATGRSAWLSAVVAEKLRAHVEAGGSPLDPPQELMPWVKWSRDERTAAARTAKAAVDAGVMTALEKRLDLEGELVADTLASVLDALDLSHDQRIFALGVAQAKLSGEALPEPLAPNVEEPGVDAEQARREREFRELMARDGVDADALLADDEDDLDEEDGGV